MQFELRSVMTPIPASNTAGTPTYLVSVATAQDIPDILVLQSENQISRGGALSIEFPAEWFERAVEEMPVVVARREGKLAGFLVSSSRASTEHLALSQAKYRAYPAAPDAYNSGPLCIAADERGHGLVGKLFDAQRSLLPGREVWHSSGGTMPHRERFIPSTDFEKSRTSPMPG
jgi:hypothetical protein